MNEFIDMLVLAHRSGISLNYIRTRLLDETDMSDDEVKTVIEIIRLESFSAVVSVCRRTHKARLLATIDVV